MSYSNEYGSNGEYRQNQERMNEYGSERRGYGSESEQRSYGYGAGNEYNDRRDDGIHTEAGRNAQGHFNNAAEGIGRAAAAFEHGGGRDEFNSVGNPLANRHENEGEHANPFLKPAQELAAATQEGLKGLPGAIFEFATGQYHAHKVHPEGHRPGQEERRDNY